MFALQIIIGPIQSGKTQTALNALETQNVGDNVLVLTPSEAAAKQFRTQFSEKISKELPAVTSLAAWALSLVRAYHQYHNDDVQKLSVYSKALVQEVENLVQEAGLDPKSLPGLLEWGCCTDMGWVFKEALSILEKKDKVVALFSFKAVLIDDAHEMDAEDVLNFVKELCHFVPVFLTVDPQLLPGTVDAEQWIANISRFSKAPPIILEEKPRPIQLIGKRLSTHHEEVSWIYDQIITLKEGWVSSDELVILAGACTSGLTLKLHQNGIKTYRPYEDHFYDRKEIRWIIAYLRAIFNPNDFLAFIEVAKTLGWTEKNAQSGVIQSFRTNCLLSEWEALGEQFAALFVHLKALKTAYEKDECTLEELVSAVREVAILSEEEEKQEDANASVSYLLEEIEENQWNLQAFLDFVTLKELELEGRGILILEAKELFYLAHRRRPKAVIVMQDVRHSARVYYLAMRACEAYCIVSGVASETEASWFSDLLTQVSTATLSINRREFKNGDQIRHAAWGVCTITKIDGNLEKTVYHLDTPEGAKTVLAKYATFMEL